MTDRPRRILWIGKRPTNAEEGDEVVDRKTIAACRQLGHHIDLFHPAPVSRLAEVANMLRGVPYQRARFATRANRRSLWQMAGEYDVIICSWEPFDWLAAALPAPTILITHNISSHALPGLFPGNPLAALASAWARAWERRCYRTRNFAAVAALSRRDLAYLRSIGAPNPLLLPPGMPPCLPLAPDAAGCAEIVVSGTYDWSPKRRDLMAFAQDYAGRQGRFPVRAHNLPPQAAALLQPGPRPSDDENRGAIRFGLITDRFEAGHKLKTLAYIANNQIVLSFADVDFDFVDIPDYDVFIRKVTSVADIAVHVKRILSMPASELHARFSRFKQSAAASFTWDAVGKTLMNATETAVAGVLPSRPADHDPAVRRQAAS